MNLERPVRVVREIGETSKRESMAAQNATARRGFHLVTGKKKQNLRRRCRSVEIVLTERKE